MFQRFLGFLPFACSCLTIRNVYVEGIQCGTRELPGRQQNENISLNRAELDKYTLLNLGGNSIQKIDKCTSIEQGHSYFQMKLDLSLASKNTRR